MINTASHCPCGSGNSFGACCKAIHISHAAAAGAEQLMRARYSAFVVRNIDFLYNTFHPSTRRFQDKNAIRKWSVENKWMQLHILKTTFQTVEFEAHYLNTEMEVQIHHEKSTFKKLGNLWYYVDGK
ncbi:zinc chelation protein SecC [Sphingobacterium sp. N143]|uniref:YchJ family protein n=1 Tax=Sphingobacterium sp. N143 TaxID=2746727 RepID=UPI002575F43D|nr:YchJ family metal-binding protein [Sphingobacterium sp. N143]MDM1293147.1 zinc chelation protein SecC [Sphingobacterium sp. N143]